MALGVPIVDDQVVANDTPVLAQAQHEGIDRLRVRVGKARVDQADTGQLWRGCRDQRRPSAATEQTKRNDQPAQGNFPHEPPAADQYKGLSGWSVLRSRAVLAAG